MLIGNKELCKAAYYQAAPHHCYGRALKCSKEEAMGLLAAVRQWYKRDHDAEQKQWMTWMQHIADRLKGLSSLTAEVIPPEEDLSNRCANLKVSWDASVLGITGTEVAARLDAGTPRIVLDDPSGKRPDMMRSSISVTSYMLAAGEERVIADALYEIFSKPGQYQAPAVPNGAPAAADGKWAVTIQYLRGTGEQQFLLEQQGNTLTGEQHGEIFRATIKGAIHGNEIELHSSMAIPGNPLRFAFKGTVDGNAMKGTVNMGEYGDATWSALRA
jgi:hypothetical protein